VKVEVCYALPDVATRIPVVLDAHATVEDALVRSRIEDLLALDRSGLTFAIFGRRATLDAALHDGDRVEILRPLTIDPMQARRLRARKASAKASASER